MKNILIRSLFLISFISSAAFTFSQNGEALFKAKCNACHIMGKDGTGPNLQSVKAKWEGEEEFLYQWVLNPAKVIAEGKSQRAQVVKDYSPTAMTPQAVSEEEAKAIIDYVDAWVAPAPKVEVANGSGEAVIVSVPDYQKNLSLFYVLLLVIGLLLIAILIISRSTSGLIKSDLFKQKLVELNEREKGNGNIATILALMLTVGLSNSTFALSTEVPQVTEKTNLWLYVENSDLYVLLIIALLLLGFLLHSIRMFYGVLRVIKPESVEENKIRISLRKKKRNKFTQILTGAVPLEEEHKIDLGHDYDGIRELDNPMPPWWLFGFFVSIVFAVIYMFHYHVLGTGDLQVAEYEKNVALEEEKVQAYLKAAAMDVDETNATLMTADADLLKGKSLFINNCAVCHKEDGRGEAGPNLTDEYWIYGNDIKNLFGVIKKGTSNGMPEHQSKFNPIQIQQVASYVLNLEYISVSDGGKEPQGDQYSEGAEEQESEVPEVIESEEVVE